MTTAETIEMSEKVDSRVMKLNLRLSERERMAIEAEAAAAEIENLSVWARGAMMSHLSNFGISTQWFLQSDTIVLGVHKTTGDLFISDGRAGYRVPKSQRDRVLADVAKHSAGAGLLERHGVVKFSRHADLAEVIEQMDGTHWDAFMAQAAGDHHPLELRTLGGVPVLVPSISKPGRLLAIFDGLEQPIFVQQQYVRLVRHYVAGSFTYVGNAAAPNHVTVLDAEKTTAAVLMAINPEWVVGAKQA